MAGSGAWRRGMVVVSVLLVGLLAAGWVLWKRGTPYQQPFRSPDGAYHIQKYSNRTLNGLWPTMPGQGSDAIDGYIRLYDTNGRLLAERFEFFIRDIEPVWAGDRVYLKGVAEMDADPWLLARRTN